MHRNAKPGNKTVTRPSTTTCLHRHGQDAFIFKEYRSLHRDLGSSLQHALSRGIDRYEEGTPCLLNPGSSTRRTTRVSGST